MATVKTTKEKPLLRRYGTALTNFITDKIEEGITVAKICRDFKDQGIPNEKQIYRWKKKYPEFKKAVDEAYQTFFYKKLDELNDLMDEPLPEGLSKTDYYAEMQKRRLKMDTLKFILAKIAPKMVPDLRDVPQNQVNLELPQINIVNYSKELPKKSTGNLIEGEKDDSSDS